MHHAAQYVVPVEKESALDPIRVPASLLWVAVDFPLLALEAQSIGANECAVVTESSRRGEVVYQAADNARSLAIVRGLNVNAALAICSGLAVRPRDTDAEYRRLRKFHR